jgi:hypothetical protein
MRQNVGIAIGGGHIRAVVVRGGRVAAATEARIAPGESVSGSVAELLAGAPLPRLPRPRVVVALGPALAQTRRLSGLPPLDDPRAVAQLVREGAGRFFLRNGKPLVTTGVRVDGPGAAWCAALDDETVRQAAAGVRAAGLRVDAFVPSVAALAHAGADGRLAWRDGDAVAEVELAGGRLAAVRRLPAAAATASADDTAEPGFEVAAPLRVLGGEAWRFADAYGAAVLPATEPLVHRAARPSAGRVPGWRLAVASAAAAAALAAALALPPLRAMRAGDDASARLALMQPRRRAAAEARRELARATEALAEVSAVGAVRWSPTRLLADLARALPPGAALVSFRADTAAGSIVALAPRAASVVAALERVDGVSRPEISGAVTRETSSTGEVERVTVRFRLDPRRRALADASAGGAR